MNLFFHGAVPRIYIGDAIYEPFSGERYDIILTDPPFGTKGANQAPDHEDFTIETSNKQIKNAGVLNQNLSIVSNLAVWVSNGFNDGTVTSGTEQDVIYGTQSGYNPSLYNASIVTSQKLVGVNTGP